MQIEIEKQLQLPEEEFIEYSDDELETMLSELPDEVDLDELEFKLDQSEYAD